MVHNIGMKYLILLNACAFASFELNLIIISGVITHLCILRMEVLCPERVNEISKIEIENIRNLQLYKDISFCPKK